MRIQNFVNLNNSTNFPAASAANGARIIWASDDGSQAIWIANELNPGTQLFTWNRATDTHTLITAASGLSGSVYWNAFAGDNYIGVAGAFSANNPVIYNYNRTTGAWTNVPIVTGAYFIQETQILFDSSCRYTAYYRNNVYNIYDMVGKRTMSATITATNPEFGAYLLTNYFVVIDNNTTSFVYDLSGNYLRSLNNTSSNLSAILDVDNGATRDDYLALGIWDGVGSDNAIAVWDASTGNRVYTSSYICYNDLVPLCFSQDKQKVLTVAQETGNGDWNFRFYDNTLRRVTSVSSTLSADGAFVSGAKNRSYRSVCSNNFKYLGLEKSDYAQTGLACYATSVWPLATFFVKRLLGYF